jgi:hypothetical protein
MTSGDGVKEHTGVEPEKGEPRMKDKCQRFVGRNNVKSSDRTPRPTITARQRIEQAVAKAYADQDYTSFLPYKVTALILAERRRIRREVGKLRKLCMAWHPADADGIAEHIGYIGACDDILTRLRG